MQRKLLSLLVLLMTAATGAWAQDTYTVTFSGFCLDLFNTTFNDVTLPIDFTEAEGYNFHPWNVIDEYANKFTNVSVEDGEGKVSASLDSEILLKISITDAFDGAATIHIEGSKGDESISRDVYVTCVADAPANVTQTIPLVEGENMFSTYLAISLDDLKAALVASLPLTHSITIESKSQNTKYNGSRWRGQLNSLDVRQMYKITVLDNCEFTLEGLPIDPAEYPITIANGENWIGYPYAENMSIAYAFEGFAVAGDVISSQTASATYSNGKWEGTLKKLEPGQGYIYQSAASDDRTFTYPELPETQVIPLAAGENWFSTYLNVSLVNLQSALEEATGGTASITINSQGSGSSTFVPTTSTWRGKLTTLDVGQMYMIKVEADCDITLEGSPIDPAEHPVTIKPGYNWIGMPLSGNTSLNEAFAGFAVSEDKIFSSSGTATYSRGRWMGSSLTTLELGKGYIYYSAASVDRTLVFPTE